MATTFKPKIMRIFIRIMDSSVVSVLCFLNFLFICSVSVVFFGEFVENGRAFAQEEEPQKCIKLIDPTTVSELQELRVCLKKLARERKDGNENKTIKRSYEGSLKLIEKLTMKSDNKSSKNLPEES
ncbi:MAG: hypothetical protein QGI53_10030 [SAR324 cluster bacterium]|nr:hypothetical protein [SAR324 cluster bacterium]